jgi:outer membrane immunogenic protein
MLAANGSAKGEYMYNDFASVNYFSSVVPGGFDSGREKIHTVKAGINYHFN